MFNLKDIQVKKNESLKKYCTFQIGGKAKYVIITNSSQQLLEVCKQCNLHKIKYKVIGMGANLLFDDNGFDGAIIVNKSCCVNFENNEVTAESGVNLTNLILKCCARKLSGLESLVGIPSTVGGGIVNNVGAFNTSISDCISDVECYNKNNLETPIIFNKSECNFSYRNSMFKNDNFIITKAKILLKNENIQAIKKQLDEAIGKKSSTQPLNYPSAGSIFKRGKLIPAKVIEELGLKGLTVGDAQISTKHSGFIINLGNATSQDVKKLISIIKTEVNRKYNELLETEIEYV